MAKVGDYVRIKHMYNETKIAKITEILEKDPCYHNSQMYQIDVVHQYSNGHFPAYKIYDEDIIKFNSDILKVLEIGDYVNGERILCFKNEKCNYDTGTIYVGEFDEYYGFNKNDIKSVITKEQINKMEYKIKE